jgi:hypothetical protein
LSHASDSAGASGTREIHGICVVFVASTAQRFKKETANSVGKFVALSQSLQAYFHAEVKKEIVLGYFSRVSYACLAPTNLHADAKNEKFAGNNFKTHSLFERQCEH